MGTTTPNYNLYKPALDEEDWGDELNSNFDTIDTQMKANADAILAQILEDLADVTISGEAHGDGLFWDEDYTYTMLDSAAEKAAWVGTALKGIQIALAIDGNDGTYYQQNSNQTIGDWYSVDLSVAKVITRIEMKTNHGLDFPRQVLWYGSATGAFAGEEQLLMSSTQAGSNGTWWCTFDQNIGSYRYYRMVLQQNQANWMQINEMDFEERTGSAGWENKQPSNYVEDWNNVSVFSNSWVNYGAPQVVARYLKDPLGFVHVEGTLKDGTPGTLMFTLPAGYRPDSTHLLPAASNVSDARVEIEADGSVNCNNGGSTYFGFSAIFRAA